MASERFSSRERLLEVVRILQEHTDKKEMMTIHEIQGIFPEASGVGTGSIREDLHALENSIAFPVVSVQEKNGLEKHYHYDGRLFEVHELRLLLDAISAAKFIPKQEVDRLLMKIRKLTSRHLAKQLNNELHVAEESGHATSEVTSFVQLLHEAIQEQRQINFQYGRYGTDLEFNLSNGGNDYLLKPLGLVWNNDRYYLVGYFMPDEVIRQYRVDRMRNVRVLEEYFVPDPYFDLKSHLSGMFHMFGGELISLEAEFANRWINVVIDRFGAGANIQDQGNGTFILKSQVAMSEGLVRWLLRWGSDTKVLHPAELVAHMKDEAEKIYRRYH